MKKRGFLDIVVVAIAMWAACLISCSKEDLRQDEEVVIDSNVLAQGVEETVSVDDGNDGGISLSYDTWIRIYRKTNLGETEPDGKIVKVRLNNVIETEDSANEKQPSELKTPAATDNSSISFTYDREGEPSYKEAYVLVYDSVMLCTRTVNDVLISHKLHYQCAVYDDGKTKQVMPYYRYENVKDLGLRIETRQEEVDGDTFFVKIYTSTISVEFNGKTYLSIQVLEERVVDSLISSVVVAEGKELLEQDNKTTLSGKSLSWIEVEQVWSQSGYKKFKVESILNNFMTNSYNLYSQRVPEMYYAIFQIKRDESLSEPERIKERIDKDVVVITENKQVYKLEIGAQYSDEKFFDLIGNFFYEVPVYKDKIMSYEMPHYTYDEIYYNMIFSGDQWVQDGEVWKHPVSGVIVANFGYEAVRDDLLWIYVYSTEFIYQPQS